MNLNTNKLKEIILEEFDIDIDSNSRERSVVEARMIYGKILRNHGWTMSRIGKTINRNHATIVHYMKKYDDSLKYNKHYDLEHRYDIVNNAFNRHLNKNYLSAMTRSELEQTIEKLLKDEKYI